MPAPCHRGASEPRADSAWSRRCASRRAVRSRSSAVVGRLLSASGELARSVDLAESWGATAPSERGQSRHGRRGHRVRLRRNAVDRPDAGRREQALGIHARLQRWEDDSEPRRSHAGRPTMDDRRPLPPAASMLRERWSRSLGIARVTTSLLALLRWHSDGARNVYLLDSRTGAVHVFDEKGARPRVYKPAPNDIKNSCGSVSAHLAVAPSGDVVRRSGRARLHEYR